MHHREIAVLRAGRVRRPRVLQRRPFGRKVIALVEHLHPVVFPVGDEHAGSEYASVIYIGSAPDCAKNRAYLPKQKQTFLQGRSAPDFAAMDFEVDFKGRATEEDLTDLGRAQMGF